MADPGVVGCSSFSGSDHPDAAQTQCRPPSPHPEDGVQGADLGGLRSRPAPAGQPDVVDRGGSTGMVADHGPNGQARYADAAIQTSLMLRTAFKLALRQTEGLMTSV